MPTYDTFIASTPDDGLWVRHLAARLAALDLEVFFGEILIADGDVVVHRIEEGLVASATAILVCSRSSMDSPLVRDEYAAMVTRANEGTQRIIPLVLHDVVVPPLLAHRGVVDFRQATSGPLFEEKLLELARAIVEGKKSPDWLTLSPDAIRQRFRPAGPRLAHLTVEGDIVTLAAAGKTTTGTHNLAPDRLSDLLWSLGATRKHGVVYRGSPSATATRSPADIAVERLGTYLGTSFLDGPVGAALCNEIDTASAQGATVRLSIATDDRLAADLPWETLIPPGRAAPLGLDPHVEIYREVASLAATPVAHLRAPLRVLAVLAAPDNDDLDIEDEQRRLHDAFESPRRGAGVHVRVLNEGSLASIREALLGQEFHILHLACHASPGALLLESDDGAAHRVDAAQFAAALPPNRRPSLVVLSGCSTALSDGDDLQGLARALIAAGVPQVLAMTAAITDIYAREFCGRFYRELALAQRPEALPALASARRLVEQQRRQAHEPEPTPAPVEWATPALFLRGLSIPLYALGEPDASERLEPIGDPYLGPEVPLRAVGEFVGRRLDIRALISALKTGRGVLIHGIGGVGKSSLAAELLRRIREDAGLIVTVVGRTDPDSILAAVADTLFVAAVRDGSDEGHVYRRVAAALRLTQTPWRQRLAVLLRTRFAGQRMTLLLDNAESNATIRPSGVGTIDDTDVTELLAAWVTSPGDSRLIVTSRVPLAVDGRIYLHHLGALSVTETRRLMWRLPALNALAADDQRQAYLAVGGHPRTLEYLDTLLRRGDTGFTEVRQRLERLLRERNVGDPRRWMVEIGDAGLDKALAESIALIAHDSLLASLLELVTPDDLTVLVGIATSEVPADVYLVKALLTDGDGADLPLRDRFGALLRHVEDLGDEPPGVAAVDQDLATTSLRRLANLGLVSSRTITLASLGLDIKAEVDRGDFYSMHPWTAERIRYLYPGQALVAHRRLAYAFAFRALKMLGLGPLIGGRETAVDGTLIGLLMARRHAHAAGETDFAIFSLYLIYPRLMNLGKYALLEQLYEETHSWVEEHPNEGTTRNQINILLMLSQVSHARGAHGKAEEYALKAQELATSTGDDEVQVSVLHQLGESYLGGDQNEKAAVKFRAIIDLLGDNDANGKWLGSLGLAYYGLGNAEMDRDIDLSEQLHRRASELFQRIQDRHNGAKATHSLGNIAAIRGDPETAKRLYLEALEVFQQVGDRICTVRCYGELGTVARTQGQLPLALEYQRKALRLAEEIGDTDGIQRALGQIAHLMRERGSRDLELDSLRRALDQALDVGQGEDARRLFMTLGNALEELQYTDRLAPVVHEARTYFQRTGDAAGLIWAYTKSGDLDYAEGQPALAKSHYLKALSMAHEYNAEADVIGNLLFRLGGLTERQGDYAQALNFFQACLATAQQAGADDVVRQVGTRIVTIEGSMTFGALSNGPAITNPKRLASMYATLALDLGHVHGHETGAVLHRIAAYMLTLLTGSSGDATWQEVLLAADVEHAGPGCLPASYNEFAAALSSASGDQFERLAEFLVPKSLLMEAYQSMAEEAAAPIAELLPPHLAITWLPLIVAATAATVMVAEGRRNEYEEHIVPVLDQHASEDKSRRVITAIKQRIVGEPWRPPLPDELTHVIIATLDQQIGRFRSSRSSGQDDDVGS